MRFVEQIASRWRESDLPTDAQIVHLLLAVDRASREQEREACALVADRYFCRSAGMIAAAIRAALSSPSSVAAEETEPKLEGAEIRSESCAAVTSACEPPASILSPAAKEHGE